MDWTDDSAITELEALRSATANLVDALSSDEELVRWILRTRYSLSSIFGEASDVFTSFSAIPWNAAPKGILGSAGHANEIMRPELGLDRMNRADTARRLATARGFLAAGVDIIRRLGIAEAYDGKDTGPEASEILKIVNLAERKFRQTMRREPTSEKEVQDRFEDLLLGSGITFKREVEHVEYSSKNYIPDFTVERSDLAIEIKYSARASREREMIAEINDDIIAYQQRWGEPTICHLRHRPDSGRRTLRNSLRVCNCACPRH